MVVSVLELVNYLLFLDKEEAKPDGEEAAPDITPLKLQKLLYYCQGYSLGLYGEPLFSEPIEAWENGPVVRCVYNKFSSIGRSSIPFEEKGEPQIEERAKKIAQIVMKDKGRYSANTLRNMTHKEKPWYSVFHKFGRNSVISEDIIRDFFASTFDTELSPDEEEAMFTNSGTCPTQQEWDEINKYVASL